MVKLSELDALDGGYGDGPPGPPPVPVRPTPWKAPAAATRGVSLAEMEALDAGAPPTPPSPPAETYVSGSWDPWGMVKALPGAVAGTLGSVAEAPIDNGARYLMGVANLPTAPFRSIADWVAEQLGVGGQGTFAGEIQNAFGAAPPPGAAPSGDPGLFSYGTALASVLGVEEGRAPGELTAGRALMKGVFTPLGLTNLPQETQDALTRGVLNLAGGILEDPTAIAGLATGGARVVGKELATSPAVAKLATLIDNGIAVVAVPGISAEGAAAFGRAKQAYDVGDYNKAAQYALEGVGYLGLGGLVAAGTRAELRGGAGAAGDAAVPPGPPPAPGAAGAVPAVPEPFPPVAPVAPIPPVAAVETTFDGELLGAAPLTSQTSPVLGAAVAEARELLLAGRALDQDAVRAARESFAEMAARQEPIPLVEIEVADARKTLKLMGWDNERIGKAGLTETEAALAEVGLAIRKPDAPPVAELGTAEWERASQELAEPTAERSLDDILDGVAEKETGGALSKGEEAAARTTALDIYKQTQQGAPLFMPYDKRAEMLRSQFGDRAEAMAVAVQRELRDLNQGHFYDKTEYASAVPPPDLTSRQPTFEREGTRQWVVRLDKDGAEIPLDTPASKDWERLVSWAAGPDGTVTRAGGVTRLRGEQHFLVHNRALGDHDLPTSFKPIKAAAEKLGWRQAPPSTSSPAAQRMYRNFEERGYSGNGEGRGLSDVEAGPGTSSLRVPEAASTGPEAGGVPAVGRRDGTPSKGLPRAVEATVGRGAAAGGLPPGPPDAPGAAAAGGTPPEAPAPQTVTTPQSTVPPTAGNLALKVDAPPPSTPDGPPAAPGPYGPRDLTEPILKLDAHAKVVEVVGHAMQERGIVWDRRRFPVLADQMLHHLHRGEIPMSQFLEALYANKLTLTEFTDQLWRPAVRDGARRLNLQMQLARKLDQIMVAEKKLGKSEALTVDGVRDALRDLGTEIDAPAVVMNYWQRVNNIWRGLLVSQLVTTSRNVTTQMANVGVNSLADTVDYGLARAAKGMGWDIQPTTRPLEGLRIGWLALRSLSTFGQGKLAKEVAQLTDDVLDAVNDDSFRNRLFNTYNSDVATAAADQGAILRGVDKGFAGVERAVDWVNTLNRGQEHIFRRSAFVATLDGELGAKGLDLADVVTDHNRLAAEYSSTHGRAWQQDPALVEQFQRDRRHISNFIDEDVLNKAINKSLELTFGEAPQGRAGKALVTLVNNTPLVYVFPFPRFFINALKWQYQYSPLGALRLLSKQERASMASGNFRAASQAIVGTAMLYTAWQLRQSESAGERWYEFKVDMGDGKTRTIDIRPFNPFAFHFFVADLMVRRKQGRIYTMTSEDLIAGFLNVNLRAGTGLAMLDAVAKGATSLGDWDEVKTALGRMGGEYLAGFLTPLQPLADAYSQFDADSRISRDRRQDSFWGPIKARIPGMEKTMPERELPTRSGPQIREFPLLRQLTGLNISDPQSAVEVELARLQFAPNEIFRGTKSPQADALVKHYLGEFVEDVIDPTVQSREYQALSDAEKGMVLAELLAAGRKEARKIASAEQPEFFGELRKRSMRQKLLEAELTGEQESEMAGGSGGPPAMPTRAELAGAGYDDEPPEEPQPPY